MKVMILCGGKGMRMQAETEYRPKPMVPIGGRPILWHIMQMYAHHGHKDFILCLGYRGDMIKGFFRNYLWNTSDVTLSLGRTPTVSYHNCPEEDWTVTLVETGADALTGARVRQAGQYISPGETFLLTYGDGLSDVNVNDEIDEHRQAGKICTLTAVHPAGRFGALQIDEGGAIHTFNEKPQYQDEYINGGFMVCDYGLFEYLPEDVNVALEESPLTRLTENGQLHSFRHEGFWQCMDTPKEMDYLNELWETGKAPWKVW